jgi:hypothetical protein
MTPVAEVQTNLNPASESRNVVREASASAESTTRAGTVFSSTPGLPQLFESNFDYQLARGMLAGAYGEGGAVGESYSTARRIKDKDIESWTVEWTTTAERIEGIAAKCLSGGHIVSAREAFLRASVYWRTGFFYLETKDPRQFEMYQRHRSSIRDVPAAPLMLQASSKAVQSADRARQHSL